MTIAAAVESWNLKMRTNDTLADDFERYPISYSPVREQHSITIPELPALQASFRLFFFCFFN